MLFRSRDDGEPIEGNWILEITWTVIPLLLVLLIAAKAIAVNHELGSLGGKVRVAGAAEALRLVGVDGEPGMDVGEANAGDSSDELGPVVVIARQWSWEFIYPDGVRSAELHLPLNRPVRFRLLSLDVLHGFSIPAFRLRQDVVPGSVIDYRLTPSREGRYRLRDSLFSGAYFAANQADVVVESPEAFEHWLAAARVAPLQASPNAAHDLWRERQERGKIGRAHV